MTMNKYAFAKFCLVAVFVVGCGKSGIESGVPLPILVAESNHHHVGLLEQRPGPDGVHLGTLVILPEIIALRPQDPHPTVVAVLVDGDGAGKSDWKPLCLRAVGDLIPPIGMDLTR